MSEPDILVTLRAALNKHQSPDVHLLLAAAIGEIERLRNEIFMAHERDMDEALEAKERDRWM